MLINLILLLSSIKAGVGFFDGPERNCSFSDPIRNVTYDSEEKPPLIGGIDFLVTNNQRNLKFCVTVPEGYEIALTLGIEFT